MARSCCCLSACMCVCVDVVENVRDDDWPFVGSSIVNFRLLLVCRSRFDACHLVAGRFARGFLASSPLSHNC